MTADSSPPPSGADDGAHEPALIGAPARALTILPPERAPIPRAAQPDARALIALSIAFGLALGFYSGSRTGVRPALDAASHSDSASLTQALPWKTEIAAEAQDRRETAQLVGEVRKLRAQVEQLRHASEALRTGERLRALEAGRNATQESSRAQDRAKLEVAARLDKVEDRLGRLEKASADKTPTGAIVRPDKIADDKAADAKAKSLNGRYLLRDVSGGVALIERRDGLIEEVALGDDLPGAGRVTAIERRGRGWAVVTTKGVIDQREY